MHRFSVSPPLFRLVGPALGAGLLALIAALPSRQASGGPPAAAQPTPEEVTFFETKIRPVLAENCYSCHGGTARMAGLRVDSREALLKGGDSGTSLIPGDPDKSLLIQAIRHSGKIKMPQGGKLKDTEIADLAAWVKGGAPWPATTLKPGKEGTKPEAWRKHWSLEPVRKPTAPKVKNTPWVRSPIDSFVLAKLEAKGLKPAAPVDRRTLLRRVTYDLTGLPPTPSEMSAFLADKSPDAYAKVVGRLLASPRYGERWARLWLDIARYADTKGYVFTEDRNYPNAYTYRDWVIRAFNEDLPYDRFVQQQLAADLLPEVQQSEDKRPLAALGFLTVGRRFLNSQPDIIDDRIDVTMRGFQGYTVACARCHDHKFDPVPTQDYYSLYGVFASTEERTPAISPRHISDPYTVHENKIKAAEDERVMLLRRQIALLRAKEKDSPGVTPLPETVKKALQAFRVHELPGEKEYGILEPAFESTARERIVSLKQQVGELKKSYPPVPEFAMALVDSGSPTRAHVFKRGNPGNPGEEAPRRFLLALSPAGKERTVWTKGSGRLELAQSIASKNNPLTARVFANRVWQHHFGAGIVRTPSDFGRQGELPTHPQLLDWLAASFMEDGWSIKRLHRRILLSSTYQMSSEVSEKSFLADPENRLLSHQNRRRLDMEQMRDTLLWAAGKLDISQVGGKSVDIWAMPAATRRAVYGFIERQNLPGTFRTFDFAGPDATSPQRFRTTVPQQALFLMNSPLAQEQARALASLPAVANGAQNDAMRIRRLYLRLFNRLPDPEELQAGVGYIKLSQASQTTATRRQPVWQYGYGGFDEASQRVSAFTPLPHYTNGAWQGGPTLPDPNLGWVILNADGGHPGGAQAAIRRFTASRDMTVSVSGTLRHGQQEGDGVRARVVSSRTGKVGEWTAYNGEAKTDAVSLSLKAGDTLDFVVDCRTNESHDSFMWSPDIVETGVDAKSAGRWSARKDFGGPPPAPLDHWARYAQALLMTNEFMFVD